MTLAATVHVLPISNDGHFPVPLGPNISVTFDPRLVETFVSITISGLPPGDTITDGMGVIYHGDRFTIPAANYLSGLTLTTQTGDLAVSGALSIFATMTTVDAGPVDSVPATLLLTLDLQGAVRWVGPSGDWNTPANWNTNTVPLPTQDVVINVPGVVVTSSGAVSIDSLVVGSGSTLRITGNTFSLATQDIKPLLNAGTISVDVGVNSKGRQRAVRGRRDQFGHVKRRRWPGGVDCSYRRQRWWHGSG